MSKKQKTREQFLKERQTGLGGSDIGAIMGIDPWRNAVNVYYEKTRETIPDDAPDSIDLERGRLLEPIAAAKYTEATGREIVHMGDELVRHPEEKWAMAHPDGEMVADEGVCELKAPRVRTQYKVREEGARDTYIMQGLWECFVGEYEYCGFGFLNMESDPMMLTFDVQPDDEIIAFVVKRAHKFWHDHVVPRVAPSILEWGAPKGLLMPSTAPVEATEQFMFVEGDDNFGTLASHIRDVTDIRLTRQRAQAIEKARKEELMELMRWLKAETAVVEGFGKVYLKHREGRQTMNEPLLRQATPLDYDKVYNLLTRMRIEVTDADLRQLVALLDECRLDIDSFKKRGNPYDELRVYPTKRPEEVTV